VTPGSYATSLSCQEIVLVTEIAALSEEADLVEDLEDVDTASFRAKANKDIGLASQAVDWSTTSVVLSDVRAPVMAPASADILDSTKETAGIDLRPTIFANGSESITGITSFLDRWEEPTDNDKKVRQNATLGAQGKLANTAHRVSQIEFGYWSE
jgi:hypothetical protein